MMDCTIFAWWALFFASIGLAFYFLGMGVTVYMIIEDWWKRRKR